MIIQQTFGVTNKSYRIVQYKRKNLIPNGVANKAVNVNKKRNTVADKKLNAAVKKAIDADKKLNIAANKRQNNDVDKVKRLEAMKINS